MTQIALPITPLPQSTSVSSSNDETRKEARRLLWLLKARANVNDWDIQSELEQLSVILEAYAWAAKANQEES